MCRSERSFRLKAVSRARGNADVRAVFSKGGLGRPCPQDSPFIAQALVAAHSIAVAVATSRHGQTAKAAITFH